MSTMDARIIILEATKVLFLSKNEQEISDAKEIIEKAQKSLEGK